MGKTKSDTKKELSFVGYPVTARNHIVNELSLFLTDELARDFTSRDYKYEWKKTFPFRDKKKVPQKYHSQEGCEHTFKKGMSIGTKVEIVLSEEKIDHATIKVEKESWLKIIMIAGFCIFFILLAYGLTIFFYEYWVIAFLSLFVCFCLTFLIVILPGVIGLVLGFLFGWGLSYLFTPRSSKEANTRDVEFLSKHLFRKADDLMSYNRTSGSHYNRPISEPSTPEDPYWDSSAPPIGERPPPDRLPRYKRSDRRQPSKSRDRSRNRPRRESRSNSRRSSDDEFWDDDEF